jgi:hypothetical protein
VKNAQSLVEAVVVIAIIIIIIILVVLGFELRALHLVGSALPLGPCLQLTSAVLYCRNINVECVDVLLSN